MKQIRLLNWTLEIDASKTKEFYEKAIEQCGCLSCINYREAARHFKPSIVAIFTQLGINPSKPSHLSEFGEMEDKLRLYSGSYHLVGRLVEGEYCTDSNWNAANTAETGNFKIGINQELTFVPEALPRPVLQIDFEALIPWVLNEKAAD